MPLSQIEPYYRTGTATFGATATVTGQGTAWLTNVEPGDQIYNRIGQMAVVLSVDSNTQITLVAPFAGTAQTAQAYSIYRVPDSVRLENFSQRMINMLKGGNLTAEAAIDGTGGNWLSYFIGAGAKARTAFTAAARSLVGLTGAANKLPYFSDANTAALTDLTPKAREILAAANAAAARAAIGSAAEPAATDVDGTTNLNDIIAPGPFNKIVGPSNANHPAPGSYFYVDVKVLSGVPQVYQELTAYFTGGAIGGKFVRGRFNGTWSPWRRVAHIDETVNKAGDQMTGALGIGVAPVANKGGLQVLGGTPGAPATSGVSDAAMAASIRSGNVELDIGVRASGTVWAQPRSSVNFGTNFNLELNPNGGQVLIPQKIAFSGIATGAVAQGAYLSSYSMRHNVGNAFVPSSGFFTAPVAGLYHFDFGVINQATAAALRVRLARNGIELAPAVFTVGSNQSVSSGADVLMAAGDYIGVFVPLGAGLTDGVNGYNFFSGFLVG